jgi:hypothetical protein
MTRVVLSQVVSVRIDLDLASIWTYVVRSACEFTFSTV